MNKRELVEEIAARTKVDPQDVASVIDGFIDVVKRSVIRGEKVVLSGFGTFHRQARARRVARNLWTEQRVAVPPTNVPAFRPGKPFREAVARRRRARASAAKSTAPPHTRQTKAVPSPRRAPTPRA